MLYLNKIPKVRKRGEGRKSNTTKYCKKCAKEINIQKTIENRRKNRKSV